MTNVQVPRLGESVNECVLTNWLVEVGGSVEVGQEIAEIATDKADPEISSPVAGTVEGLRGEVDCTVRVGEVIAVIYQVAYSEGDDGARASTSASGARHRPQVSTNATTIGRTESGAGGQTFRPVPCLATVSG